MLMNSNNKTWWYTRYSCIKNKTDSIHFIQTLRNFFDWISKRVECVFRKCMLYKWQTHFMYHLFSFPRDEKNKRQMLILDIINFVFISKQSYKFLSIVKGIIYWNATLQYQDEFCAFLDKRIYVILSSKYLQTNKNLFYKLYLTWKQRKHTFFLQQKLCSMDEMGR